MRASGSDPVAITVWSFIVCSCLAVPLLVIGQAARNAEASQKREKEWRRQTKLIDERNERIRQKQLRRQEIKRMDEEAQRSQERLQKWKREMEEARRQREAAGSR